MRVGVDVMGGDHAPDDILDGALEAAAGLEAGDRVVLFGDARVIEEGITARETPLDRVEIVPTTESIGMDESAIEAVRGKKDSSLVVMCRAAGRKAESPLDAVISAGNTGAFVAAAQMYMRRLPGVIRPGIAAAVPTPHGHVLFIDVGANIEPKPHHLHQYGVMGTVYARCVMGIEAPRVALMNVGGEEQKGTAVLREARDLLRDDPHVDFVGFVEGRSIFTGATDVVISDGVVGNVTLKVAEGMSEGIFHAIAREVAKVDPGLLERFEEIMRRLYAEYDYHEYGGAPLLGVNGACLISHGSSRARTIANAVRRSMQYVSSGVNRAVVEQLEVSAAPKAAEAT